MIVFQLLLHTPFTKKRVLISIVYLNICVLEYDYALVKITLNFAHSFQSHHEYRLAPYYACEVKSEIKPRLPQIHHIRWSYAIIFAPY